MSTTAAEKAALRRAVLAAQRAGSTWERRESDQALFARFLSLPEVAAARFILLFAGMGEEPDTTTLMEALFARGKGVALPRCLPEHGMEARRIGPDSALVRHRWGMWEPGEDCPVVERERVDLILVPGLCYDRHGIRLGRGGGFYDRYLAGYLGIAVGLCRAEWLQEILPREAHDRPVDLVLTEGETIRPVRTSRK